MSAQRFTRRHRTQGTATPPSCVLRPCNGTGLYRWEIAGYVQGSVCSRHRNELERTWQSARTTREAA